MQLAPLARPQLVPRADSRPAERKWTTVIIDRQRSVFPARCVKCVYTSDARSRVHRFTEERNELVLVQLPLQPVFYVHSLYLCPTILGYQSMPREVCFGFLRCDGQRLTEQEAVQLCLDNRWFDQRLKNPLRSLVRHARIAAMARAAGWRPPTDEDQPANGPGPRMTFRIGELVLDLSRAPLQLRLLNALWDVKRGRERNEVSVGELLQVVYDRDDCEQELRSLIRDVGRKLKRGGVDAKITTGSASVWLEMPSR